MKNHKTFNNDEFILHVCWAEHFYEMFKNPNVTVEQLQDLCKKHNIPKNIYDHVEDFIITRKEKNIGEIFDLVARRNFQVNRTESETLSSFELIVVLITNPFSLYNIPLIKLFDHFESVFELLRNYQSYLNYHIGIHSFLLELLNNMTGKKSILPDHLSLELDFNWKFKLTPFKLNDSKTNEAQNHKMFMMSHILGKLLSDYRITLSHVLHERSCIYFKLLNKVVPEYYKEQLACS